MRTAVVFDFDDTLTVKKAKSARSIDYDYLRSLFGSTERLLLVVRQLRRLKKDADVYICSGNDARLITRIFEELYALGFDALPLPTIHGNEDNKPEYINALQYNRVIFVDNDAANYEGVAGNVETIAIESHGGMTEEQFMAITVEKEEAVMATPKNKAMRLEARLMGVY